MSHFKIIKASAGSGKTFALVKHYLSLAFSYSHQYGYQKILAITFTNKAAGEMKERVIGYLTGFSKGKDNAHFDPVMLKKIAKQTGLSEEEICIKSTDMLTHMVHHYNDIAISTIDTFVHRIIRSFARDLNLNLDFEVELDPKAHFTKVIDDVLEKVGLEKTLTKHILSFVNHKMEDKGRWKISNDLKEFAQSILLEETAANNIEKLAKLELSDFEERIKIIQQTIKEKDDSVKVLADQTLKALSHHDRKTFDHHKYNFLLKLRDFGLVPLSASGKKILDSGSLLKKNPPTDLQTECDSVTAPMAEKLSELYADNEAHQSLLAIYNNLYLTALLTTINKALQQLKKDNNLLFIGDFNHKISEVVKHEPAPFIYERIGERFNHILIDEFQDTSELQWKNLLPLIDNGLAKGKSSLIVGDAKQAIYRFRNGDVEQFVNLPDLKNPDDDPVIAQQAQTLRTNKSLDVLPNNFRSSHHIINFNNSLLSICKNNFSEYNQLIYDDYKQKYLSEKPGYVRVKKITETPEQGDKFDLQLTDILNEVQQLHASGEAYENMAFLVRNAKEGNRLANILAQHNIPFISQGGLNYENDSAIKLLLSALQYMYMSDELFNAQVLGVNFAYHFKIDLYTFFEEAFKNKENNIKKSIENHLGRAINLKQTELSLYEHVERLIADFGLNNPTSPFIVGFMDMALNFQQTQGSNLGLFIEWLLERGLKKALSMPENIDAVKIVTIHASKGLQYPTVFIPNLYVKDPNFAKLTLVNSEEISSLPNAIIKLTSSLLETTFSHIYEEEKGKSDLDNINLMYVAITRPESNLYIWFNDFHKQNPFNKLYGQVENHTDWNTDNNEIVIGSPVIKELKNKASSNSTLALSDFESSQWNQLENISFAAPENWDYNVLFEKTDQGTLYHEILALIFSPSDLPNAINSIALKYSLNESETEVISNKLNELFELPQMKLWFNQNNAQNELTLLTQEGNILRPDRVVFSEKETTIIDYKTGHFAPHYRKQLNNYAQALMEMGYKNVTKHLVYIDNANIEQYE